jgi:hypothetical protein
VIIILMKWNLIWRKTRVKISHFQLSRKVSLLPVAVKCNAQQSSDAQVIPLQSLGIVDVEENEILAHALANISQSD